MGRSGGPTTRVRFSNVLKFPCATWKFAAERDTFAGIASARPKPTYPPFPETNMTGKQSHKTPAPPAAVQQAAHS